MGLAIFLLSLGIIVMIFAYYCYRTAFYSSPRRQEDLYHVPDGEQYTQHGQHMVEISLIMQDAKHRWVYTTGQDGTPLAGRYYGFYPGAPVILAFHGYRSMALRDCAGAFALAQKLSFNILAVDQRGHGQSGGKEITFGIRERQDCLQWVHWLRKELGEDTPILLSGISMGAATVLMASELDLPANVCCILADCPYDSPAGIIGKVAADMRYPEKLARPVIRLAAGIFARLDLHEASAIEAVRYSNVPILLIHGEDDRFVPCSMSRHIAQNCTSPIELHTFAEAGHGLCYIQDPRRYEKICVDFLWRIPSLVPHLQLSEFARSVHRQTTQN